MKQLIPVLCLLCLASAASADLMWSNGPWVTGAGNGSGGADTSVVEPAFGSYGYLDDAAEGVVLADDFTVPVGQQWNLGTLRWYAFERFSGTTSSITGATVTLYNGSPAGGGSVVASSGANCLLSSAWSGAYRVPSSNLLDTQRPVMENVLDVSFAPTLGAGTYWLAVSLAGSALYTGPYAVPVTPARVGDNALEYYPGAGWQAISDPQDLAFTLESAPQTPEPASLALAGLGLALARARRRRQRA